MSIKAVVSVSTYTADYLSRIDNPLVITPGLRYNELVSLQFEGHETTVGLIDLIRALKTLEASI